MFKSSKSVLLALAACSAITAAHAGERKLFENVSGWEVERNLEPGKPQTCVMSYSYKDKEDDNAENAVIVMRVPGKGQMAIVLGYEKWGWDKDEKVIAQFAVDKNVLYRKQGWEGDGTLLTTSIPDAALDKLSVGKQIIVKFDDNGTAEFRIPGFGDAFASLKRCDAAAAQPSVASPDPLRVQVYLMGLVIQNAAANCDVPTTGKQREALDGKIAALKPEMAPVEDMVRTQLRTNPSFLKCPNGDAGKAMFSAELVSYTTLSPEEYAAAAEKREKERHKVADKDTAPKP